MLRVGGRLYWVCRIKGWCFSLLEIPKNNRHAFGFECALICFVH